MAKLRLIATLVSMFFQLPVSAQSSDPFLPADSIKPSIIFEQKDTIYWIENFRQFRDALYKGNKLKAKAFINFPFVQEGNEIWYLASRQNEEAINKIDQDPKPFTERDFDKYFDEIFPKTLVKCFLKIKMDELYKKGETESPEIKQGNSTYKLHATFDKKNSTVELNLSAKTAYNISATEYEVVESNFIYRLQILKNGHLNLKAIFIAG